MTNAISTVKCIANRIIARIESEEKGHGLVETALVLSFFLFLTFGMIDFSRCIYTNSVVSAAAQEGARAGIIDTDEIQSAIASKMIGLNLNNADIDITLNDNIVQVEIAYDFQFITPLASTLVDTLALSGKASMISM